MHVCVLSRFSHVWLFVTPWTEARQAPLSMGFSRQVEWVAISSSRGSSWPRDRTHASSSPALAGRFFTTSPTGKHSYSAVDFICVCYLIIWSVWSAARVIICLFFILFVSSLMNSQADFLLSYSGLIFIFSGFVSVLASCGCYNKHHRLGSLKQ